MKFTKPSLILSLLAFAVFFLIATNVDAQTKSQAKAIKLCNLTLADSPKLRGFFLGQTKDELFQRLPLLKEKYNESAIQSDNKAIGLAGFFSAAIDDVEEFADINFDLSFLDGKLYSFSVKYENYEPDNLKTFIKQISDTSKLPSEGWKIESKYSAKLNCADFSVWVWTGREEARPYFLAFPTVDLTDLKVEAERDKRQSEYKKKLAARQKEQERIETEKQREDERKKKIFKP